MSDIIYDGGKRGRQPMVFRIFLRRGALALMTASLAPPPLAAQPPPDYSLQPNPGDLIGGTPEVVARCVHQVRMEGVRWDAYNETLNARIAFARRLPAMSEIERSLEIRRLNLAILSESPDRAERQRQLDLLLDARARDPASHGASLLRDYVEEMRGHVEDARRHWRSSMAECVSMAWNATARPQPAGPALSPAGAPAPGDGSWTGTYVSRAYPTIFQFTGGGATLSATFDGRFSDVHNAGRLGNCRASADGGFDCDYKYRHEDAQKTGDVSGRMHLTHRSRCMIEEGDSVITAVDLKALDGSPATSPSLYVGAKGGGNTYDRQGCS
jgi:hypothetical protein